jgi:peptidoglycan hydrolase CwlO-like protein
MEGHGIEWEQKGTREKHLSVLDYEKKMRSAEVEQLETRIEDLQADMQDTQKSVDKVQVKLKRLQERESLINLNVDKYDSDPKWQLPEPTMLMTANAYKTKIVEPFIRRLKDAVRSIVAQYLRLKGTVNDLKNRLSRAYADNERLMDRIAKERQENVKLAELVGDYKRVRNVLGEERTDSILIKGKAEEQVLKHPARFKNYEKTR